jgi:C4-dicarboxylate-specific signal transduction histidine kinase
MTLRRQSKKALLNLETLIKDAVSFAILGNPDLVATYDLCSAAIVRADRIQVQQVLLNLLQNSCEAVGGEPCRVEIRSLVHGKFVQVCISDAGPGIAPDVLPIYLTCL